jgi:hypothetical protein
MRKAAASSAIAALSVCGSAVPICGATVASAGISNSGATATISVVDAGGSVCGAEDGASSAGIAGVIRGAGPSISLMDAAISVGRISISIVGGAVRSRLAFWAITESISF